MPKLSDDEIRALIAKADPDAVVAERPRRRSARPPASAKAVPDRSELAAKVARVRGARDLGLDAEVAPPPLTDIDSQMVTLTVTGDDDTEHHQAAVVSTTTGDRIAEQG
jgi:hypothetical protein